MKLVGLTGGVGTGKTLVGRVFNILGIPVYNADNAAKQIVHSNSEVKYKIIELFGENAYIQNKYNSAYIRAIVFNDSDMLNKLNSIIHPAVEKDFTDWCKNFNTPFVLKEAALLYETKSYQSLDLTIVVDSPEDLRIKRVKERDPHRTTSEIESIMKTQWPQKKKMELADFIIHNGYHDMIIPQVMKVHQELAQDGRKPSESTSEE